jgi:hypothetical protein
MCKLGGCWGSLTQTFVLSAYLSLAALGLVGVGLLLVLLWALRRRQQMICDVFFATEFGTRFGDDKSRSLRRAEWAALVSSDPTALSISYRCVEFSSMSAGAVFIGMKLLIVAASSSGERGSLLQLACCAAAELFLGLIVLTMRPAASVEVNTIYGLASAHQVLMLGLLAHEQFRFFRGLSSLQLYMVGLTLAFLIISVGTVAVSAVRTVVRDGRRRSHVNAILHRAGFYSVRWNQKRAS